MSSIRPDVLFTKRIFLFGCFCLWTLQNSHIKGFLILCRELFCKPNLQVLWGSYSQCSPCLVSLSFLAFFFLLSSFLVCLLGCLLIFWVLLSLSAWVSSLPCLMIGCYYVVRCEISIPLLSSHLLVLSWLTEVICIEKFSVLVKIFQLAGLFRRD